MSVRKITSKLNQFENKNAYSVIKGSVSNTHINRVGILVIKILT